MKSLIILSLVAIASATTNYALNAITTAAQLQVSVTALLPEAGVAPTLISLSYPTTYDSSSATVFAISGAVSVVGNNTVRYASVTFTNGNDVVILGIGAAAPDANNTQALVGSAYPVFRNAAAYTASVTIYTVTFGTYSSVTPTTGTLASVTATPYVNPTLNTYSLVSPQTGGCGANSCSGYVNGSATTTARSGLSMYSYLRTTNAASGARFAFYSSFTNQGASDFNVDSDSIYMSIGGVVNGVWVEQVSSSSSVTHVPQNAPLTISAQITESVGLGGGRQTWFSEAAVGAKQASVTFTSGTTDVTAPTCSVATVDRNTVTTYLSQATVVLTITCVDNAGGVGLWNTGFFASSTVTSGTGGSDVFGNDLDGAATFAIPIPQQVSGSLNIIGIWAIDNAGNAALYGSCGGIAGWDTICGAGSSASTVAFSMFSVVVLAIFALLF